jgi:hypothetical protein
MWGASMNKNFQEIDLNFAYNEIEKYSNSENEIGNMFVEMLKDEIDSTEESEIYQSVKKLILKYIDNKNALKIIDEVIEAISGGASMTEVLLVARDEVIEPTPVNVMSLESLVNEGLNDNNYDNKIH